MTGQDSKDDEQSSVRDGWALLNRGIRQIVFGVQEGIEEQPYIIQLGILGVGAVLVNIIYDALKIVTGRLASYAGVAVSSFPGVSNVQMGTVLMGAIVLHGALLWRRINKLAEKVEHMSAPSELDDDQLRTDGGNEIDFVVIAGSIGGAMIGYALTTAYFPDWGVAGAVIGAYIGLLFIQSS